MTQKILIFKLFFALALFAVSLANPFSNFDEINFNFTSPLDNCGVAEPQGHYGFFPWMAVLWVVDNDDGLYNSFCTATIVAPNWLLTAAHCLHRFTVSAEQQVDAYVGARNPRSDGQKVVVSERYPHAKFNWSAGYDIGLAKLETPLEFDGIKLAPVCLGGKFEWDQKATIAGWGHQHFPTDDNCHYRHHEMPATMEIGEVTLLDPKKCANEKLIFPISPVDICTKPYDSEAEHGDSGGPLMIQDATTGQWREIGITSHGECHYPKRDRYDPVIYTSVTDYCDWIKETSNGEVQC